MTINKNHKIKEMFSNFVSFGVIELFGMLIPIITLPILTRTLGPSSYGSFLLILSIFYFGNTIIDYGTNYTSVRKLSKNKANLNKVKKIFKDTQSLRLVLAFIYFICCIIYAGFFLSHNLFVIFCISSFLYFIGYALTPIWYYQALGRMGIVTKISLIVKCVNLVVILFFIKNEKDLYIALLSSSFPMFISGLYFLYLSKKEELSIKVSINIWRALKSGFHVFVGLLAPNLYNSIPTIVLGTSYPPEQFAQFAIASRLCSVVISLQNILAKAVYPVISRMKEIQISKLIYANLSVSIPPLLFLYFFGTYALRYFLGKDFDDVNQYLVILIIGVVFVGLANSFSQGFFLPKGLDRIYRNISLRVSFLSAGLAFLLISHYGLMGGALSITVARILFFVDYIYHYKKITLKT
ncbi:oligosaccharide flippase family protein [Photobacterium toruni]|uniref:oligosaccharide flippase family protein n=1 Tax=Photobacterium toruni TaxID=1935446 RepID=UPI002E19EF44|nr:oligosaccharide flippase family protein [Photobacterium toruni]